MTKYGGNTFKTMTIFYVADVMPNSAVAGKCVCVMVGGGVGGGAEGPASAPQLFFQYIYM